MSDDASLRRVGAVGEHVGGEQAAGGGGDDDARVREEVYCCESVLLNLQDLRDALLHELGLGHRVFQG